MKLTEALNEDANTVRDARRRLIMSTAKTGREGGEEGEENGNWYFESQQGIKITELGPNSYEVRFEGEKERGDFEETMKRIKAASKKEYARREAKLEKKK
jgi:hypothetical protein